MIGKGRLSGLNDSASSSAVLPRRGALRNAQPTVTSQRLNKAHTATAHRLARRFSAIYNEHTGFDIQTDELTVEVETTATIADALDRLANQPGLVYVAVTNREGIHEALRLTHGTRIGVMDPQGEIIRESSELP